MNIKQKLTTAVVLGSMVAAVVAPASFAATTTTITDNGALSTNKAKVINVSSNSVKQKNSTVAVTTVTTKATTGKNTSSFNTGGTSSITTKDATNTVVVGVSGGTNENTGGPCGCAASTTDATIIGNGALSTNKVFVLNLSSNSVYQSNSTVAVTTISTSANTGGNSASFNTGGGNTISTGAASNEVTVGVGSSSNTNN